MPKRIIPNSQAAVCRWESQAAEIRKDQRKVLQVPKAWQVGVHVELGIRAILSYTPLKLTVPPWEYAFYIWKGVNPKPSIFRGLLMLVSGRAPAADLELPLGSTQVEGSSVEWIIWIGVRGGVLFLWNMDPTKIPNWWEWVGAPEIFSNL